MTETAARETSSADYKAKVERLNLPWAGEWLQAMRNNKLQLCINEMLHVVHLCATIHCAGVCRAVTPQLPYVETSNIAPLTPPRARERPEINAVKQIQFFNVYTRKQSSTSVASIIYVRARITWEKEGFSTYRFSERGV